MKESFKGASDTNDKIEKKKSLKSKWYYRNNPIKESYKYATYLRHDLIIFNRI